MKNLLYDMTGREENFLERNLLAPYEIIAEKPTVPSPFPQGPSKCICPVFMNNRCFTVGITD